MKNPDIEVSELTPTDRQLLARDVAADAAPQPSYGGYREAFCMGWDAAMEYIEQEAQRVKTELEQPPRS